MGAIRALPISDGAVMDADTLVGYVVAYRELCSDASNVEFFFYQALLFCALNNLEVKYKVLSDESLVHFQFPEVASEVARKLQATGKCQTDPWMFTS